MRAVASESQVKGHMDTVIAGPRSGTRNPEPKNDQNKAVRMKYFSDTPPRSAGRLAWMPGSAARPRNDDEGTDR